MFFDLNAVMINQLTPGKESKSEAAKVLKNLIGTLIGTVIARIKIIHELKEQKERQDFLNEVCTKVIATDFHFNDELCKVVLLIEIMPLIKVALEKNYIDVQTIHKLYG